ncbi:MAG: hypothetical protein FJZ00_06250, partial [Candidatus Sericytochromatia bacterium]|nr:hypothetical protein [Candidatus Tanganyikabacteria bacterium]
MSKIEGPGQAPKTMAPKKASEAGMVSLEDCPPETAAPPKSDAAPARDSQAPSEIKP